MKQTKASEKKQNRELIQILEIFYRTLLDIYIYIYLYHKWRSFGTALLAFMCPSAKHPDSRTKRSLSFRHLRRTLMVDLSWFPVLARDTAATALMLESSFLRRSFKELMTDALWYLPEKKSKYMYYPIYIDMLIIIKTWMYFKLYHRQIT